MGQPGAIIGDADTAVAFDGAKGYVDIPSGTRAAMSQLSLYRQCLRDRRFGTVEELREETMARSQHSNEKQRGVDWQFRIDDARTKLKSLYPKIQS